MILCFDLPEAQQRQGAVRGATDNLLVLLAGFSFSMSLVAGVIPSLVPDGYKMF